MRRSALGRHFISLRFSFGVYYGPRCQDMKISSSRAALLTFYHARQPFLDARRGRVKMKYAPLPTAPFPIPKLPIPSRFLMMRDANATKNISRCP